jgi:hypothetical protein
MYDDWPILLVSHRDDGTWSFVNGWGDTDDESNAMTVHVELLVALDPSTKAFADLRNGWRAWRETRTDEWHREPEPPDADDAPS